MPTLGQIAEFLGAKLEGDPALDIRGVASLDDATEGQLSFLANPRYASKVASSKAGCLLLSAKERSLAPGRPCLISANPYRDFARVMTRWFSTLALPAMGVHPLALVSPLAKVGPGCRIGPYVVVEDGAEVGESTVLFPFCYVGHRARVGASCLLYPSVTVLERCLVGDRVILHSGVVLGSDGFGFAPDPPSGYVKVPQQGWVEVQDDVEIQANACVDRGTMGATRIGRGSKLDNLVQIAHNVVVGENTVLAAQSGISGSTRLGSWVTIAGQAAAGGHLTIHDRAIITGQAGAGKDVPAGAMVSGSPAQPTLEHHRGLAELQKLPKLKARVKELEQRLAELERKLAGK